MGDGADMAISEMMNAEDDRFSYRMGMMTDAQAYDLGLIDERGFMATASSGSSKQCRYCRRSGLHWTETNSGWRLASADGTVHSCSEHKL